VLGWALKFAQGQAQAQELGWALGQQLCQALEQGQGLAQILDLA